MSNNRNITEEQLFKLQRSCMDQLDELKELDSIMTGDATTRELYYIVGRKRESLEYSISDILEIWDDVSFQD